MKAKQLPFYKAYNFVINEFGMASVEFAIVTIILSYQEAGKECYLSLQAFADVIKCSKRTVQNALAKLCADDIVEIKPNHFTLSNIYYIEDSTLDCLRELSKRTKGK